MNPLQSAACFSWRVGSRQLSRKTIGGGSACPSAPQPIYWSFSEAGLLGNDEGLSWSCLVIDFWIQIVLSRLAACHRHWRCVWSQILYCCLELAYCLWVRTPRASSWGRGTPTFGAGLASHIPLQLSGLTSVGLHLFFSASSNVVSPPPPPWLLTSPGTSQWASWIRDRRLNFHYPLKRWAFVFCHWEQQRREGLLRGASTSQIPTWLKNSFATETPGLDYPETPTGAQF